MRTRESLLGSDNDSSVVRVAALDESQPVLPPASLIEEATSRKMVTSAGPNRALYKNERFDELLHQARLTTDQGKRAALYREAKRILVDDPPWIFVDHEIQTAAHAKRVQGFKLHPSFDLRVETISLK